MGIIVTLPPPRRKRVSAAPTSEATILLFMGVRYVREMDDDAAAVVVPSVAPDRMASCPPLEIA